MLINVTRLDYVESIQRGRRLPAVSRLVQGVKTRVLFIRAVLGDQRIWLPHCSVEVLAGQNRQHPDIAACVGWPNERKPVLRVFAARIYSAEELRERAQPMTRTEEKQAAAQARRLCAAEGKTLAQIEAHPFKMLADDFLMRVLLHECAHLLAGPYATHDEEFGQACARIGRIFGYFPPGPESERLTWPVNPRRWPFQGDYFDAVDRSVAVQLGTGSTPSPPLLTAACETEDRA